MRHTQQWQFHEVAVEAQQTYVSRRMRFRCSCAIAQGKLGFVALELLSQSEHCAIESRLAISDALVLSSALHPSQLGAGGRREWVTRPSRRVFCLCSSKFGERNRKEEPKRKGSEASLLDPEVPLSTDQKL